MPATKTKSKAPQLEKNGVCVVNIEEVAEIRSGNGFPIRLQGREEGEIPFFKVGDISRNWQKGQITLTKAEHYVSRAEAKKISPRTLPEGSVVFAKIGAAVALNRRAILGTEALVDNNVMALVPLDNTTPKYLFFFMCHVDLGVHTRGGAVPSLRRGDVADLKIPLPPLPEQRRIVARIEELFTRLDAGVAALHQAKAQLKRYRQSVLAAAVTGELTKEWREKNPDTESAKELLKRILKQRRELWRGRGKYKEAPPLEAPDLPDLPSCWIWATTTQIFSEIKDGTHDSPKYQASGIPFITQKHIKSEGLIFDDYKFITQSDHDHFYLRSNPEEGDILISMIGANRGQSCVVLSQEVFSIKNVGLFKPHRSLTNVNFLQAAISSLPSQQRLLKTSKGGAQPFVGLNELRTWALPLPPLAEQHQIVAEIEARTNAIDHLEAELDRQITRSNRFSQSALGAAFRGDL